MSPPEPCGESRERSAAGKRNWGGGVARDPGGRNCGSGGIYLRTSKIFLGTWGERRTPRWMSKRWRGGFLEA